MPLLYLESFEGMTTGNPPTNPPWTVSPAGDVLVSIAAARIGTKSLEITRNTGTTTAYATSDAFVNDRIGFITRTPADVNNSIRIETTRSSTTIFYAGIISDAGALKIAWYDGATWTVGSALSTTTWYWIEIRITAAGTYDVYLDGVAEFTGCTMINNIVDKIDTISFLAVGATGAPWTTYVDYVYINRPATYSDIGTIQLASVQLGSALAQVANFETIAAPTETDEMELTTEEQETITTTEATNINITVEELEATIISLTEDYGQYPALGYAGVLGKIVLRMDVDSTDFCTLVEESGQSITINGANGRAFLQVQQSKRSYDHGKAIYPGDAVMYSCPEDDPELEIGDEIYHDGINYVIIAIQNAFFNGNLIYRESALMKRRTIPAIGQITGLIASDNYEGKTTLTWDEMDADTFSHYEVWESLSPITYDSTALVTNELATAKATLTTAYLAGDYSAGQLVVLTGFNKDDGDYALTSYGDDGYGKGQLVLGFLFKDTTVLGTAYNMKNYYLRDKTKSTNLSVKNLTPNVKYYYMVRAIDVYGNAGRFSTEASTDVKTAGTRKVEGLR